MSRLDQLDPPSPPRAASCLARSTASLSHDGRVAPARLDRAHRPRLERRPLPCVLCDCWKGSPGAEVAICANTSDVEIVDARTWKPTVTLGEHDKVVCVRPVSIWV